MLVQIYAPTQEITINGVNLKVENWKELGIPSSIKSVSIDTEKEGVIDWMENIPPLTISIAQFDAMFSHAVATYNNIIANKQLAEMDQLREENEKYAAERAAETKIRINRIKEHEGLLERVTKLEAREKL